MGEIRDKTTKWMWSLAPSHMKEGNKPDTERDSYKLLSIWAKNTENFKQAAYKVRRNRFPQWANEDALNLLGEERGIKPLKGESLEDYRTRVINALYWWKLAGTVKGIKTVFNLLGFEDVKVFPADPGGERWAEFNVKIATPSREITPALRDFVVQVINEIKPAHEKLAELILSYLAKGEIYYGAGAVGEQQQTGKFVATLKWTATGKIFYGVGVVGEQHASAVMEV